VESVAQLPGRVLADGVKQLGVGQMIGDLFCVRSRDIEQSSQHPGRKVRHLEQSQQSEGALLRLAQPVIAHSNARSHLEVARGQFIEPTLVLGKPMSHPLQSPVRLPSESGARDPQRQWQISAQRRNHLCGRGLSSNAIRSGNLAKQLDGLLRWKDVKINHFRARKPGQSGAAGDENGVAGARRYQWANLRLIGRIIKQHKRVSISHQRAIQVGALVNVIGDGLPVDAQGAQKSAEHIERVQCLRLDAAQVDVQLTIRKQRAHLMRGMDSKCGLSHSRLPNRSRDHQRCGLTFSPLEPGA
jgi:hypothetical protein